MTSLINAISSDRQNASNALRPKETPKAIIVYVEAIEDKSFWYSILNPYFKLLDFRAYSNEKLTTGKIGLQQLFNQTGEWLLICVDSDYDYLLSNRTESAKAINQNPYIFQTYAYATENLKCYANSLQTICVDITHNPTPKIDFVEFLEVYSKTIYELFIWHLYFLNLSNEDDSTDFYKLIQISNKFNLNAINEKVIDALAKRIDKKLSELKQYFSADIAEVDNLTKQLKLLGLEEKTTYLFIQGHALYDNVVLNLVTIVCKQLKFDEITEIKKSSAKQEHKDTTRNYYNNLVGGIDDRVKTVLSLNKHFKSCFLFDKIIDDIKKVANAS